MELSKYKQLLRDTYAKGLWNSLTFSEKKELFNAYYELLAIAENGQRVISLESGWCNLIKLSKDSQWEILFHVLKMKEIYNGAGYSSIFFTLD